MPPLYALLIGINAYRAAPTVPNLRGAVNDVRAMRELLERRFGVPAANILDLEDDAATRASIAEAFHDHLTARARAWHEKRQGEAPALLLYYSGHGSTMNDPAHGTADETVVPCDSRTPGVFDIPDWELRGWANELARFSDNFTAIMDCCHSGSILRGETNVRLAPAAERPPELAAPPAAVHAGSPPYVLIAGCRNSELAFEHPFDGGVRGVLSHALTTLLAGLPDDADFTYRDLHERVAASVSALYRKQTPQIEGDADRLLFTSRRVTTEPLFTLSGAQNGRYTVDAGAALGLRPNTLLDLYPPQTRRVTPGMQSIGRLSVTSVTAASAEAAPVTPAIAVPPLAKAAVAAWGPGRMELPVAVQISDPVRRAALQSSFSDPAVAAFIAVADGSAPYRVVEEVTTPDTLWVTDASDLPVLGPYHPADDSRIAHDLSHIARFLNARRLAPSPSEELDGHVELRLAEVTAQGSVALSSRPLPAGAAGEVELTQGQRIRFEITNLSAEPLYVGLLEFAPDWSVTLYYPPDGARTALAPGATAHVPDHKAPLPYWDVRLAQGLRERRSMVRVIASPEDVNYRLLEQRELARAAATTAARQAASGALRAGAPPSALQSLLAYAAHGEPLRTLFVLHPPEEDSGWTTTDLSFVVKSQP